MNEKEICRQLRAARKEKRIRVDEIAEMIGVSNATVYAIEKGYVPKNISKFLQYARYMGVNI